MASGTTVGERKLEMVCGCGARGFVAARFAGARIRCRSCGQHAVVGDAAPATVDVAWAPVRTPPKAQRALAPVAPVAPVALAPVALAPALDLLPEPEAGPSLVPMPGPAPARGPARDDEERPRTRHGRAKRSRGAGGFEAAQAAAGRDVDQERHVRAIAFWWRLTAILGVVGLGIAVLAAVVFKVPLGLLLPVLIVPAIYCTGSYFLGRGLWMYHDAARWVGIVLNGLGLVLGAGGVLTALADAGVLVAGVTILQLAWPAAIVKCLLSPRSAALCTEEYRQNVERSPGVRVPWCTSLFFIVPAALIGLGLLLTLVLVAATIVRVR